MEEKDPLFVTSAKIIVANQLGSTSLLQRKLQIGYNRANLLMDQLEHAGIVGPNLGAKGREVQIKGQVALRNLLSGLGFPSDEINSDQVFINTPALTQMEETYVPSPPKDGMTRVVLLLLLIAGFFYTISNAGFGRELSSALSLSQEDYQAFVTLAVLIVVTWVLWSIRNTPLGFLWQWYKLFWIVLFTVLLMNYAKKQIKDWWKKDN